MKNFEFPRTPIKFHTPRNKKDSRLKDQAKNYLMSKFCHENLLKNKKSMITREIERSSKLINTEDLSDESFKQEKAKSSVPYYFKKEDYKSKVPVMPTVKYRRRMGVDLTQSAAEMRTQFDDENTGKGKRDLKRKQTSVLMEKLDSLKAKSNALQSKFVDQKFKSVAFLPVLEEELGSIDSMSSFDSSSKSNYAEMIKRISEKVK